MSRISPIHGHFEFAASLCGSANQVAHFVKLPPSLTEKNSINPRGCSLKKILVKSSQKNPKKSKKSKDFFLSI